MKALVYLGPQNKALQDRSKPTLAAATDAIVRVTRTTICGTDLHILKGDVPTCAPGRILGHEGVGIVDAVGAAVTAFKVGDPVLISCVSACGKCVNCRRQMYSHCTTGGWILGNSIDGFGNGRRPGNGAACHGARPSADNDHRLRTLLLGLRHSGGTADGDALAQMLRLHRAQPVSWLARNIVERRLVHMSWRGQLLVPLFQFDCADMKPLSGLAAVVETLNRAFDDWELACWFAQSNDWLQGKRPADLLASDAGAVMGAARADRFIVIGG